MAVGALGCGDASSSPHAHVANGSSAGAGNGVKAAGPSSTIFPFPGSLDVQVNFPVGIAFESWQYQVLGPSMANGTVEPPDSDARSFHVDDVAPGWGTVTVTASALDGTLACKGTGPFILTPGMTEEVDVEVGCQNAVADGGTPSSCPIWRSIQVTPGEVPVGQSAQLSFFATGPMPRSLSYSVTEEPNLATVSPAVGPVSPAGSATTVTCTAVGVTALNVTFAEGPVADAGSKCPPDLVVASVSLKCDADSEASAPIDDSAVTHAGNPDPGDADSEDPDAVNLLAADAAVADADTHPAADASIRQGQLDAETE